MQPPYITYIKIFILLFAIIDPFGNIPLFLAMTAGDEERIRRRTALKACVVSFLILSLFAIFGDHIMKLFAVEMPAFQVAGGIVLAMFSLPMLTASRIGSRILASEEQDGITREDISVVPLAIPLMAGPGAITAVIVISRQPGLPSPGLTIIAVIAVVLVINFLLFRSSTVIARIIGNTGLNVLTRIMGLVILVVAVQFILEGAKAFFTGH